MKKNYLIGLALAAAIVAMPGCKGKKTDATDQDSVKKVLVTTRVAVMENVPQTAVFTSNIRGVKENDIAPNMPLRIEKIFVEVGDRVRKNQLLVKMDPTQLNTTSVQLANTEADYKRIKKVYEAGGISKQEMDAIETQLSVLRDSYNNLLANTELRSPIDGVVTSRNFDPGNLYSGSVPVLTVMQIDQVKVTVAISEQYFPQVKLGMPTITRVDMYPDKTFEGKVTLISPAIDANTRTFNVEITIPNRLLELRPGMFSRTTLDFGSKEGIMVDDIAIQKQAGTNEKYVYIAENGKAVRKLVTTGTQVGHMINVLTGVNVGDNVIVTGISRLVNGTEVEVKN